MQLCWLGGLLPNPLVLLVQPRALPTLFPPPPAAAPGVLLLLLPVPPVVCAGNPPFLLVLARLIWEGRSHPLLQAAGGLNCWIDIAAKPLRMVVVGVREDRAGSGAVSPDGHPVPHGWG
jgi:hypothetical protein